MARPAMLILDEPLHRWTCAINARSSHCCNASTQEFGVTILVVAHDLNPLLNVLTSAIYLLDGHAHFDTIDEVVDEILLSHLYGTRSRSCTRRRVSSTCGAT